MAESFWNQKSREFFSFDINQGFVPPQKILNYFNVKTNSKPNQTFRPTPVAYVIRSSHAGHEFFKSPFPMIFMNKEHFFDCALLEAHLVELSQEKQKLGSLESESQPWLSDHSGFVFTEGIKPQEGSTLLSQFWNISKASSTWASS